MSSRFSKATDLAILGLVPKPYPASLNMGLNMFAYTYSVTGVRKARGGNVGPALIDIEASITRDDYLGINLNTQDEWVFTSPMSWHPGGKKAMWTEIRRGTDRLEGQRRIQVVHLLDYEPGPPIAAQPTPDDILYAGTDLAEIEDYPQQGSDIDIKIYGSHSGHIEYSRNEKGTIEKIYNNYSDDGESVYTGSEKMQLNPSGYSTYTADVKLSGPEPGVIALKMTFGSLQHTLPARIIFTEDDSGMPLSYGYAEIGGERLEVNDLVQ